MQIVTHSQATRESEAILNSMETWLVTTEEKLQMALDAIENLRKENEESNHHNLKHNDATMPSHSAQEEGKLHSNEGVNVDNIEKKNLHGDHRKV